MLNRSELTCEWVSGPLLHIHRVSFERNLLTGLWRGQCSCGWSHMADEDQVKDYAAVHDLIGWFKS